MFTQDLNRCWAYSVAVDPSSLGQHLLRVRIPICGSTDVAREDPVPSESASVECGLLHVEVVPSAWFGQ